MYVIRNVHAVCNDSVFTFFLCSGILLCSSTYRSGTAPVPGHVPLSVEGKDAHPRAVALAHMIDTGGGEVDFNCL